MASHIWAGLAAATVLWFLTEWLVGLFVGDWLTVLVLAWTVSVFGGTLAMVAVKARGLRTRRSREWGRPSRRP